MLCNQGPSSARLQAGVNGGIRGKGTSEGCAAAELYQCRRSTGLREFPHARGYALAHERQAPVETVTVAFRQMP